MDSVSKVVVAFVAIFISSSSGISGEGTYVHCNIDEFKCKDGGECIKTDLLCNGVPNCKDRSDEEECVDYSHCADDTFFQCNGTFEDGRPKCINPSWVCDGFHDCDDGSDELSCPKVKSSGLGCPRGEFRCGSGLCISNKLICDDISDCIDGSDEDQDMCNNRPCRDSEFRCEADHKCIPLRWHCDKKADCTDGLDEKNCTPSHAHDKMLACANGTYLCDDHLDCIQMEKVCDGKADCQDGSDESKDCEASCFGVGCEDVCNKMPKGKGQCSCSRDGYELSEDGTSCTDINECDGFGTCSQICKNFKGGYSCSCLDGFTKTNEGCKVKDPNDAVLFFAGRTEVRGLRLSNMQEFTVTNDENYAHQAIGVAYDALKKRVFWTDVSLQQGGSSITSSAIDGTAVEKLPINGLVMPEGLALDHVARNLYYSESIGDYIGVCNVDSKYCTKIVTKDLRQPRELALYVPEGLLFYSDWGHKPRISRLGMDGTNHVSVIKDDVHWPNGVAVDSVLKRIFWSEAKYDRLESAFFDGSDRREVEVNFIRHPFSLAVFEDRLFWSDWELRKIQSCNKFDGSDRCNLFNGTKFEPMALHIFHPVLEKQQKNPCRVSMCSHICLLSYGGRSYTCKCPSDMYLSSDARTCKYIDPPSPRMITRMMKSTETTTTSTTLVVDLETSHERIYVTEKATTTGLSTEASSSRATNTTRDSPMNTLRTEKSLRIGLGIAVVVVFIIVIFIVLCIHSARKNKCEMSPVLRYKNPAFGCDEPSRGSEDVDIFIENSPENPPKNPDHNFTENFQKPVIESFGEKHDQAKKNTFGFSSWRPRANDRYYKL